MAVTDEIVVESDRRPLVVALVDEDGQEIDLTGGSVRLQGKSDDIGSPTIDYAGTLTDPARGICAFASIGTLVSAAQLGSLKKATYNLRVKFTESGGLLWDYTPEFQIDWVAPPI